jgi:hypothetical protein
MTHYDAFPNRDPNPNPGLNCKVRHVRHTTGRPTFTVRPATATGRRRHPRECVDALTLLDHERINGENLESKASGPSWF